MKRAVYAGSFDPVTNGHLWMIQQASKLFDEVIVAIGINPDKKYAFTLEERIEMLSKSIPHNNVRVDTFENDFLVRYAEKINAQYIIRGIRSQIDFEYEKQMRNVNSEISPKVDTIFLIPPRELADVSSSFVKGLVNPDGWEYILRKYVPLGVFEKFAKKYSKLVIEFGGAYWTEAEIARDEAMIKAIGDGLEGNAYHNVNHIKHCLKEFEEVKDKLKDPEAVRLALIYHDAVYDPKLVYNEEKSGDKFMHDFPNHYKSLKVTKLIMVTKDHIFPKEYEPDWDYGYMIDIDCAILGAEPDVYDAYREAIAKEYDHVKADEFIDGRSKFIIKMLSRPNIYWSNYFHGKYEYKARHNLTKELETLKNIKDWDGGDRG